MTYLSAEDRDKAYRAQADRLVPMGCTCPDDSGGCAWCDIYYNGPPESAEIYGEDPANTSVHGRPGWNG